MSDVKQSPPRQVSRRDFLRTGAILGGAALFGPYVPNRELLVMRNQVELQFWHQWGGPPNSTALEANAAAFTKMFPNITVKYTDVSGALTRVTAAIAAGNPPDIQHFALSTAVPEFAHRGALIDLTPMLTKDIPNWEKLLYPYAKAVSSYNGKVYSIAAAN